MQFLQQYKMTTDFYGISSHRSFAIDHTDTQALHPISISARWRHSRKFACQSHSPLSNAVSQTTASHSTTTAPSKTLPTDISS